MPSCAVTSWTTLPCILDLALQNWLAAPQKQPAKAPSKATMHTPHHTPSTQSCTHMWQGSYVAVTKKGSCSPCSTQLPLQESMVDTQIHWLTGRQSSGGKGGRQRAQRGSGQQGGDGDDDSNTQLLLTAASTHTRHTTHTHPTGCSQPTNQADPTTAPDRRACPEPPASCNSRPHSQRPQARSHTCKRFTDSLNNTPDDTTNISPPTASQTRAAPTPGSPPTPLLRWAAPPGW